MASRRLSEYSPSEAVIRLPHPFLTSYAAVKDENLAAYHLQLLEYGFAGTGRLPETLTSPSVSFTEPEDPKSGDKPHDSDNTPWGRTRRSPSARVSWTGAAPPTVGQIWLITYVLFTLRPNEEIVRLALSGAGKETLSEALISVRLAAEHPPQGSTKSGSDEIVLIRGSFWQGAGSPFGPRPIWVLEEEQRNTPSLSSFPIPPLELTMTNDPPTALCLHPRRPAKPRPGSVIYSRYIPHLKETFSMVALDYENDEHLKLFHDWQNDPRVSQGWNETGTLEQHREYLRRGDEDPHQITILARFDDVFFAYFEVYWAREDRLGAYYHSGAFDRGRHSLVGDVRYRGPHRVGAWWSSLMHYLFLDDPRTMQVVGEPKYTNSSVLMYDFMHGFGLDKFVDLPHKRSAFVTCSRERFFQLSPLDQGDKFVGGTAVGLVPKL